MNFDRNAVSYGQILATADLKTGLPWSTLVDATIGMHNVFGTEALSALVSRGLIAEGETIGVTETGANMLTAQRQDELELARGSIRYQEAYSLFLAGNAALKHAIADIQQTVPEAEDAVPLLSHHETLRAASKFVIEAIAKASEVVERLATYSLRFDRARQEIGKSRLRYLASPFVDSYHSILFELHEDLILIGGFERNE